MKWKLLLLWTLAPLAICEEVPIGLIVSDWSQYRGVFTAINIALGNQMNNYSMGISSGISSPIQLKMLADSIKTVDAFKLSKIVCRQLDREIFALMGTVDPESFDTLHSYANTFEMPFLTPWFPESMYHGPKASNQEFGIQLRPDYHKGLVDLVLYYGWTKIIYIYSDFDGLLRLQQIYNNIPKNQYGGFQFQVEMVKKVGTAKEAIEFLLELEKINRNSLKRVMLDCSAEITKEILISHVNNIRLGRRNFHYILSSLILDHHWDRQIAEYGAINITGFRLMDFSSKMTKQFFRQWKNIQIQKESSSGEPKTEVSTVAILAHDAVLVLRSALQKLAHQRPGTFRNINRGKDSGLQRRSCNISDDERLRTWENGPIIIKTLKETDITGLTGRIRFDGSGKRTNFSLDVVEMTPDSELVKIGTWSDVHGLQTVDKPLLHRGFIPQQKNIQNKTYIMTTIMDAPYMMYKKQEKGGPELTGNDRFEGYCKDLADLIAAEAKVNFEIRPVKDGKYGGPDSDAPGGWNGMVGELVRKEAEIAVAPLTINSQREQVADFTKPFMSLGISIMIKKPVKQRPGVFSFMSPLSMEIWMCVFFAYIGVSIVLFLVSRFSPDEWKIESAIGGTTVANFFSMMNSLWFSLGAFMQQGVDITPRSLSGRIVGGVWWFFSLILISSYTANLAAFLTVERMVTPINSADELAQQTEIEYGALLGGSTISFFRNSKISVYARMWEFMSARPYVLTNTTLEGIQRVRESKGKYAFLIESTSNEYTNERMPCDTMKVGKNLDAKGYGIATAKGSGLQEQINLAVLNLKENGDLAKLKNKWWHENTECHDHSEHTKKNELSLSNVAGIFFILVGGLIIAMLAALFEFCYNSSREAQRAKTSLSNAMKNKAKLALSGGRDLDNIRFYGDSSAL